MHFFFNVLLPLALLASPIFATPVDLEARAGVSHPIPTNWNEPQLTHPGNRPLQSNRRHKGKAHFQSLDCQRRWSQKKTCPKGRRQRRWQDWIPARIRKRGKAWMGPCCLQEDQYRSAGIPCLLAGTKQIKSDTEINGQAHTPIRVVYANAGGTPVYCGIIVHTQVKQKPDMDKKQSWEGDEGCSKCT